MATAAIPPFKVSPLVTPGLVKSEQRRLRVQELKREEWPSGSLTPSGSHTPVGEDPLRILAPAQKKLTTIESQRLLGVMDETIKRLEGVVSLPRLIEGLERLSVSLGSELASLLEEYHRLSHLYNTIYLRLNSTGSITSIDNVSSRTGLLDRGSFGSPIGSRVSLTSREGSLAGHRLEPLEVAQDEEMSEERLVEVGDRLKHVVRCVLRGLKENPNILSMLHSTGRSKSTTHLIETMRLVNIHTFIVPPPPPLPHTHTHTFMVSLHTLYMHTHPHS